MPTNVSGINDVYLVRVPHAGVEEVFVGVEDARVFAASLPSATVTAARLRQSMADAKMVMERRLVVYDGEVLADTVTETPTFCDSADSPAAICDVDVESFECGEGHWHILGFGTDRQAVHALTEQVRDECTARVVPDRRRTPRDRCAFAS